MELVEDLGTRLINGKWIRFGIFLCPFCFQEVERRLSNGKVCQSCGCAKNKLISESNSGSNHYMFGKHHTEERNQKMREIGKLQVSSMIGKKHGDKTLQKMSKSQKGHKVSEKTRQKMSKTRIERGVSKLENNPNWNNGSSFLPYPPEFNKKLKIFIFERDNYTCQCPDCEGKSPKLDAHHIDYNKQNNNPENLIALCKSCHMKTNGKKKRQYYTEYYQNIMQKRR